MVLEKELCEEDRYLNSETIKFKPFPFNVKLFEKDDKITKAEFVAEYEVKEG